MEQGALSKLFEDASAEAMRGMRSFGIIGRSIAGRHFEDWFRGALPGCTLDWFADDPSLSGMVPNALPLAALTRVKPEVIVVIDDAEKESAILSALPHLGHAPKLLVAGYDHFKFRDHRFDETLADLLVPSIANGYPNTLVHLYQCMVNAARLGLEGALVEFGVFKGGTTMFLAQVASKLGQTWPVIGFDTFGGFPPRRSSLDMYDHPGAEFHDFDAVRRYLEPVGITLVQGDIAETASQLGEQPVVVAFIDTDNYSSGSAAVSALIENVVPGGAIVFDHYTGVDRFRYTLGERMAAAPLVEDRRYFNLHATGVFLRQH